MYFTLHTQWKIDRSFLHRIFKWIRHLYLKGNIKHQTFYLIFLVLDNMRLSIAGATTCRSSSQSPRLLSFKLGQEGEGRVVILPDEVDWCQRVISLADSSDFTKQSLKNV